MLTSLLTASHLLVFIVQKNEGNLITMRSDSCMRYDGTRDAVVDGCVCKQFLLSLLYFRRPRARGPGGKQVGSRGGEAGDRGAGAGSPGEPDT